MAQNTRSKRQAPVPVEELPEVPTSEDEALAEEESSNSFERPYVPYQHGRPKFKEGHCFETFLRRFRVYCRRSQFKTDLHWTLLECISDDKKFTQVERIQFAKAETQDIDLLVEKVQLATLTDRDPETCRVQLATIKQEELEDYADFVERIRELAERAFKDRAPDQINSRMLDALQDGLTDRNVAKTISKWRDENPRVEFDTVSAAAFRKLTKNALFAAEKTPEAQIYAINRTSDQRMRRPTNDETGRTLTCTHCGKDGHTEDRCYQRQTCQLCQRKGHTSTRCDQFEVRRRPNQRNQRNREPQTRYVRGQFECYGCGQQGHIRRNCPRQHDVQLNGQAVEDRDRGLDRN